MGRWQPNTVERLQEAAMTLFSERGYADVTIADITDRAGLTRRSFFNHFPDKREVLFAGASSLEENVCKHVTEAEGDQAPLEIAVSALTRAGQDLARYGSSARLRRDVIAGSPELRERSLIKMASLGEALAGALRSRQVHTRTAELVSHAAIAVFTVAYDDWSEKPSSDFALVMQNTMAQFTAALQSSQGDAHPPVEEVLPRPATAALRTAR